MFLLLRHFTMKPWSWNYDYLRGFKLDFSVTPTCREITHSLCWNFNTEPTNVTSGLHSPVTSSSELTTAAIFWYTHGNICTPIKLHLLFKFSIDLSDCLTSTPNEGTWRTIMPEEATDAIDTRSHWYSYIPPGSKSKPVSFDLLHFRAWVVLVRIVLCFSFVFKNYIILKNYVCPFRLVMWVCLWVQMWKLREQWIGWCYYWIFLKDVGISESAPNSGSLIQISYI